MGIDWAHDPEISSSAAADLTEIRAALLDGRLTHDETAAEMAADLTAEVVTRLAARARQRRAGSPAN